MAKLSEGKDYISIAFCTAMFYGSEEVELMQSFFPVCKENNIRVVVFSTYSDFLTKGSYDRAEQAVYNLLDPSDYDAVVIVSETYKYSDMPDRIARKCLDAGVPVISLVRPIEGCINIRYDYAIAFEQIVRHIVEEHNYKDIVYFSGMKGNPFAEERLEIFRKVLEENNIPVKDEDILYGDFWEKPTALAMDKLFESGRALPQAFVCANDYMAMEVCKKLSEHGYRVPEDVTVTGFDGVYIERFHYPRLTTARQDLDTTSDVLQNVIHRLADGRECKDEYIIPFKYTKSMSCGCVKPEVVTAQDSNGSVQFFKASKHERDLVSYYGVLFGMTAKQGFGDSLKNVFERTISSLYDTQCKSFGLFLNSDFIDTKYEMNKNVSRILSRRTRCIYTDKSVAAIRYQLGEGGVPGRLMSRNEIGENVSGALENGDCVMVTPVCVMEDAVGFEVASFEPLSFEYTMYYSLLMTFRQIIETHKNRSDLEVLHSQDQLTGLYNRRGFYSYINSLMENAEPGEELAFISLDLNWLKQINDTYGHASGDFALATVGEAMKKVTKDNEVCSRFGGDEFAIAFVSKNASERAEKIIQNLRNELDRRNEESDRSFKVSTSIGWAAGKAVNEREMESLIREADARMYEYKRVFKERNTWLA